MRQKYVLHTFLRQQYSVYTLHILCVYKSPKNDLSKFNTDINTLPFSYIPCAKAIMVYFYYKGDHILMM